jgi:hypothetical protein
MTYIRTGIDVGDCDAWKPMFDQDVEEAEVVKR